MELTKEELVKFKIWRNERRKFWAQILFWAVWGGSSLVIFVLLGSFIPEEAMPNWMNYGAVSILFFIMVGTALGMKFTLCGSRGEKAQGRKGSKTKVG